MKLFKIIVIIVTLSLPFIFYFFYPNNTRRHPISDQNNFYKNLDLAIKTAKFTASSHQIRDFNNEVEFYLVLDDHQIKIVVSTLKDPFWQVSTLQQVVKTAKIDQRKLKLVDLSSKHPYVTYKNN